MHTRLGDDRLRSIAQECRCGIDECRKNVEGSRRISWCAFTTIPQKSTRTLSPPPRCQRINNGCQPWITNRSNDESGPRPTSFGSLMGRWKGVQMNTGVRLERRSRRKSNLSASAANPAAPPSLDRYMNDWPAPPLCSGPANHPLRLDLSSSRFSGNLLLCQDSQFLVGRFFLFQGLIQESHRFCIT